MLMQMNGKTGECRIEIEGEKVEETLANLLNGISQLYNVYMQHQPELGKFFKFAMQEAMKAEDLIFRIREPKGNGHSVFMAIPRKEGGEDDE